MYVKKSILPKIKQAQVSSYKARRLKRALEDLNEHPVEFLCKTGKVTKLNVVEQIDLYAYRVDTSTRIVFSLLNGEKVIQDIVDTDLMQKKSTAT